MNGKDGVDHVNIFSRGETALGRWMSNFSHEPFTHPMHGSFNSIEGLWYWLTRGDDRLRTLSGFQAKQLGKSLQIVNDLPEAEFRQAITLGIQAKIAANPRMAEILRTNLLPFEHYYVFSGKKVDAGYKWLLEVWNKEVFALLNSEE